MEWNSNKEISRTKARVVVSKEIGSFPRGLSVTTRRYSNLEYPNQKSSFYIQHWR